MERCLSLLLLIYCVLLCGCGPRNQQDYLREGQRVTNALVKELQQIRRHEDFLAAQSRVTRLHDELVELMIAAREYRYEHPGDDPMDIDERSQALSRSLQKEVDRIAQLEGGEEWLGRCQEEAAIRLASFESQLARRRI